MVIAEVEEEEEDSTVEVMDLFVKKSEDASFSNSSRAVLNCNAMFNFIDYLASRQRIANWPAINQRTRSGRRRRRDTKAAVIVEKSKCNADKMK